MGKLRHFMGKLRLNYGLRFTPPKKKGKPKKKPGKSKQKPGFSQLRQITANYGVKITNSEHKPILVDLEVVFSNVDP